MRGSELKAFKEKLLEQKASILNESAGPMAKEPLIKGDEADIATSEASRTLSLQLEQRQRLQIFKIDHALAKIEEGTFGVCEECDAELGMKRLIARPYANLCISCQEEQEHFKRIYA